MSRPNVTTIDELQYERLSPRTEADSLPPSNAGAVSWAAVFAGGAAAASLSLILLMLGTGLSLSSVSPWAYNGITATTFGVTTILWLAFTQVAAAGMGGYLAGRLRVKWPAVHTDEVYFRDTAHGFLSWAVATLATAALLTSVIGSIVTGGVQAGASVAGGAAAMGGLEMAKSNQQEAGPMAYFIDSLFRKDFNQALDPSNAENTAEVSRIFMNTLRTAPLSDADVQYVGQLVALRTGITQEAAKKRVLDVYAQLQAKLHDMEMAAKEAADKGRKASAYAALWLFISLLLGAFVASYAATVGGRQRDF